MGYVRLLKYKHPLIYGNDVKQVQRKLNELGFKCGSVDGYYGRKTKKAVKEFQKAKRLWVDGVVGSNTWSKLFTIIESSNGEELDSISAFVSVANIELAKGFEEKNRNNISPYGKWYGMNGQPWCAMFVSWCANEAGILRSIVPRFAYCPYGVSWYRIRGKYQIRSSGYNPKAGDVIMFQRKGVVSHTGIVIAFDTNEKVVYTVEGNSGDGVRARNYKVTSSYIHGYGVSGGTSNGEIPEASTGGTDNSIV